MKSKETQAARLIRLCGIANLAKWSGRSVTQVYRWDYAKEKGGSGGIVPAAHYQAILNGARKAGIDLSPNDFFAQPKQAAE